MRNNTLTERQCQWCSLFLGKEEFHEEFEFYKHPSAKIVIRKLQEKSKGMDIEQYAWHRKLKSENGVVMPGYGRLLNCWKWMEKLEEQDREVNNSIPGPQVSPELPF